MNSTSDFMNMPPKRVSETAPVQVYLDHVTRDRLERLSDRLELTRSEVLRRGLLALERETLDPSTHPVMKLVGVASAEVGAVTYDVAREHDRYLASVHEPLPASRRKSRGRPRG